MKKIGRNDPCHCGSGIKFKKCHGRFSKINLESLSGKFADIIARENANEKRRIVQQGKGKPIISTMYNNLRLTAVGTQIFYSESHKTFFDFLGGYIRSIFGSEWGNSEIAKPLEERHQMLQWYEALCAIQKDHMNGAEKILVELPMNGLFASYYGLAYNLYLLGHNIEVQSYLIRRLKQKESFYSASYETYVAAWFILAGFALELENEEDSSKTHPEFIASKNGEKFSVEAKSRASRKNHFQIGNQLYKAMLKQSDYPRIIFIDMNVEGSVDHEAMQNEILQLTTNKEISLQVNRQPAPPAYIFVTNQPFHLNLYETQLPRFCLCIGFKIPDFGYGVVFESLTLAYKAKIKHLRLFELQQAIADYSIPSTFDGEVPEFAFGKAQRRFSVGENISVSSDKNGRIQSGVVLEQEKKVYLAVEQDDGTNAIFVFDLTDDELSAYQAHPETFFNSEMPVSKNIDHPIDFFEFIVNSYKDTPKEKLLMFMSESPNIDHLKSLNRAELLYVYAEGVTHSMFEKVSEAKR